jgi:hypothetical protein
LWRWRRCWPVRSVWTSVRLEGGYEVLCYAFVSSGFADELFLLIDGLPFDPTLPDKEL